MIFSQLNKVMKTGYTLHQSHISMVFFAISPKETRFNGMKLQNQKAYLFIHVIIHSFFHSCIYIYLRAFGSVKLFDIFYITRVTELSVVVLNKMSVPF